jgi:hypothetical protein
LPVSIPVVSAAISGVTIEYNRCKVALVTGSSAIDTIAVYYVDREGERQATYDIDPTTTDPRRYAPLIVRYNDAQDRTQIQVAGGQTSLVCVIAEAGTDRTVQTNPTEACVPEGFNTAPTTSFSVSASPTVDEPVTFTSTATDPDDPERLYYEWDLDGDGTYETTGETATTTYTEAGEVTVSHRVTDDFGANDTATQTISVEPNVLYEQVSKLVAADAQAGDEFGFATSVDGDTALVGAKREGPDTGAAYVFIRDGGTWVQQQKLTASDAQASDFFGSALALDGDTAFVGAYLEGPGGIFDAGSVYVYTRSGSTWTQQQKLTAGDAQARDQFGVAISLDGDTAIIGANGEDPSGISGAGSAYVFTRSGGTWSQEAKLTASDAQAGDQFGFSVSLDGDTALVGAQNEDQAGNSNAGSAYVFTRSGTTWAQEAKLTASDAHAGDQFGRAVSLDGDTALVGAYLEHAGGISDAGSAYVFTRSGTTWTQQQKLTAGDAQTDDRFGFSVSLDGDAAIVGAVFEDPDGNSNAGSAYVFSRSGTTWAQQQKLTASDAQADDRFGYAVSVDGGTAIAGAVTEDPDRKSRAGSAYVFEHST